MRDPRPDAGRFAASSSFDTSTPSTGSTLADGQVSGPVGTRHTFTDDVLGHDDATGVAARIAAREISATEALDAALARIAAVNGDLNAIKFPDTDRARTRARHVDASPARASAAFIGVPTAIKDNVTFAGMPLTMGSNAMPRTPMPQDGPFVRQFLDTGVNPVATTTCPPFGWTATTEGPADDEHPDGNVTRNPWNLAYSSGGSSGGSAALVAAGALPLAHANDGGGSIRIPAAACGLVGLKVTRGRQLGDPTTAHLPVDIVINGIVARSVRDVARFVEATELSYRNPRLPSVAGVRGGPARRLRIGVVVDSPVGPPSDGPTRAAVAETVSLLEGLGHQVEEYAAPVPQFFQTDFVDYWSMIAWAIVRNGRREFGRDFDPGRLDPLTLGLARRFNRRLHRLPLLVTRLRASSLVYQRRFGSHDVILTPVLNHVTPPIGYLSGDLPADEHMARLIPYAGWTPLHNATGAPAISLPLGRSDEGLPIGVMLSAQLGADRRLLELAFEIEAAQPLGRFALIDD